MCLFLVRFEVYFELMTESVQYIEENSTSSVTAGINMDMDVIWVGQKSVNLATSRTINASYTSDLPVSALLLYRQRSLMNLSLILTSACLRLKSPFILCKHHRNSFQRIMTRYLTCHNVAGKDLTILILSKHPWSFPLSFSGLTTQYNCHKKSLVI